MSCEFTVGKQNRTEMWFISCRNEVKLKFYDSVSSIHIVKKSQWQIIGVDCLYKGSLDCNVKKS